MFTDRDMRDQVIRSLDGTETEFNVTAIVDTLQAKYGTIDIERIPNDVYWEIVQKYAI